MKKSWALLLMEAVGVSWFLATFVQINVFIILGLTPPLAETVFLAGLFATLWLIRSLDWRQAVERLKGAFAKP